jgi:hypothetical protein
VLRELYLHREVMAAVDKADDRRRLDVTQVITQIRAARLRGGEASSARIHRAGFVMASERRS